jgi:DNA-directed RNA polymerase subunit RPC12/RpoP
MATGTGGHVSYLVRCGTCGAKMALDPRHAFGYRCPRCST